MIRFLLCSLRFLRYVTVTDTKRRRFTALDGRANLFMVGEQEVEVERQRGDEVDDVDRSAEECQLARTHNEPDQNLEREPCVADALDVEERVVGVGPLLVQHPRRRAAVRPDDVRRRPRRRGGRRGRYDASAETRKRDVLDRRHAHARVRLKTER